MKRRSFVKAFAAVPVVPALFAQQPATTDELPNLTMSPADGSTDALPRFFTPSQFAALRKVSVTIMPPADGGPGALEAKTPEFLDFLVAESPAGRQQLYRAGLDALNTQATKRFGKAFGDLDTAQADELLAPLREPWTYDPPADPLARFLVEAKGDVRTATMNSREYIAFRGGTGGRRGFGGVYWLPLD
jgi:Gluconate 2-dehydrogenase subunit 3